MPQSECLYRCALDNPCRRAFSDRSWLNANVGLYSGLIRTQVGRRSSERIETSMVRFYSSIYADDESLIRQMSRDSAFHGIPHQTAAAHRMKTECLGSVPDHVKHNLIRVRNSLFLVQRHDIRSASCRNATALGGAYYVSSRRKTLEYKPIEGCRRLVDSDAPEELEVDVMGP
jgi:hypothetical protein